MRTDDQPLGSEHLLANPSSLEHVSPRISLGNFSTWVEQFRTPTFSSECLSQCRAMVSMVND